MTTIIDGSKWSNPYEGLKGADTVLHLFRSWVEEGFVRDRSATPGETEHLQRFIRGIKPTVKAALETAQRNGDEFHITSLTETEIEFLKRVRQVVRNIRQQSSGEATFGRIVIDCPNGEVHFTPDQYYDFIDRSFEALLSGLIPAFTKRQVSPSQFSRKTAYAR